MPISWLDIILDRHHAHLGLPRHGARLHARGAVDLLLGRCRRRRPLSHPEILRQCSSPISTTPSIAQIAFAAGVFIISLIVVSLITFRISDKVLDSRVGALDRTLGLHLRPGARLPARRHRLHSVHRACPRPTGMGAQRALLPHSAADPGRHRIAAADESRAISAGHRSLEQRGAQPETQARRPAAGSAPPKARLLSPIKNREDNASTSSA